MSIGYTSFLIRYWRLADGARRVAIEHVQSGERVVVPTLGAALAWLDAQADGTPGGATTPAGDGARPTTPAGLARDPPDLELRPTPPPPDNASDQR